MSLNKKNFSSSRNSGSFGINNRMSLISSLAHDYKIIYILSIIYVIFLALSFFMWICGAWYLGYFLHYKNAGEVSSNGYIMNGNKIDSAYPLNEAGWISILVVGLIFFLACFAIPAYTGKLAKDSLKHFPFILREAEPSNLKYRSVVRYLNSTKESQVIGYMFNPVYSAAVSFRIYIALSISFGQETARKNRIANQESNKENSNK